MCHASFGLVGAAPERPCDDVRVLDAPLGELHGDAADFLDRPADQEDLVRGRSVVFLGAPALARWRMAAIMAKASMTSETCLCQPCQERVSLWSRPSSFLAVSKLSSMAQRWPSTDTSFFMGVPLGHHVEKKARSPSAMLRRIRRPRVHSPVRALLYSPASRSAVRDRPSCAGAGLWFLHPPTGAAKRSWEDFGRSSRRSRPPTASCPRNGTHDWRQRPGHSPCPPCAARPRSLPCRTHCPPRRRRTAPLR